MSAAMIGAMCNLYSIRATQDELRELFGVAPEHDRLGNLGPQPAIYPRARVPVVRFTPAEADDDGTVVDEGDTPRPRELAAMAWGFVLPQTSKRTGRPILPKAVNNARDDKLAASPFWQDSLQQRRCLLPATAFSEAQGRGPAIHHWFGVLGPDGRPGPFALAGLWRRYRSPYKDETVDMLTTSMVTTSANALVAPVHPERMPAILPPEDWESWLTAPWQEALALLRPYPAEAMVVLGQGADLKAEPEPDGATGQTTRT